MSITKEMMDAKLLQIKESFLIHFCGREKAKHLHFLEKEMLLEMFGEENANCLRELWV